MRRQHLVERGGENSESCQEHEDGGQPCWPSPAHLQCPPKHCREAKQKGKREGRVQVQVQVQAALCRRMCAVHFHKSNVGRCMHSGSVFRGRRERERESAAVALCCLIINHATDNRLRSIDSTRVNSLPPPLPVSFFGSSVQPKTGFKVFSFSHKLTHNSRVAN
jgi:hypothetical protein